MASQSRPRSREARIIRRIDEDIAVAEDKRIVAGKIARQFNDLAGSILHHLRRVVDRDAKAARHRRKLA